MTRTHTFREGDILLAFKALSLFPGISAPGRKIGAALIDHYNTKTGRCDPGMTRLANLTGYSRRTVIRAIEDLTEVEPKLFLKDRYGGGNDANSYTPNFPLFRDFVAEWTESKKARKAAGKSEDSARKERAEKIEAAKQGATDKKTSDEPVTGGGDEIVTGSGDEAVTQSNPINIILSTSADSEPLSEPSAQAETPQGLWNEGDRHQPSAPTVQRLMRMAPLQERSHGDVGRRQAEKRITAFINDMGSEAWTLCTAEAFEAAVIADMASRGAGRRVLSEQIGRIAA